MTTSTPSKRMRLQASMAPPEPFRGEVWDVWFPVSGEHPAVVISVNALNRRLGHIAVVPVTGTSGPALTHIPLTADAGLTRYDEPYADVTGLQPVARGRFRRRRGLLATSELTTIDDQIRIYLGLLCNRHDFLNQKLYGFLGH